MDQIPRRLLRRYSGVGWVESFGEAQDRPRYPSFPTVGIGAVRVTHPTIFLKIRLLGYFAACGGVLILRKHPRTEPLRSGRGQAYSFVF